MTENTEIEWCHHTFNPWWGCSPVSTGCKNCYAAALAKRYGRDFTERRRTKQPWKDARRWQREAMATGERKRVFCGSMCDVFDSEAPKEWRDDLWQLIRECDAFDWLLLTKRPENIDRMLPSTWEYTEPWPHVWLGTTVAAESEMGRIGALAMLPAAVRFVSFEPLVDLPPVLLMTAWDAIDWAIVGGESGPGARVMDPDWARYIRNACKQTSAAFLMKQMGGSADARKRLDQIPADLRIREYPVAT